MITGISGQDGAFLGQHLLSLGYHILAPIRKNSNLAKLQYLGIDSSHNIRFIAYKKWADFLPMLQQYQPQEIYHLAAMSHVGESHLYPQKVFEVNTLWTIELLNMVEKYSTDSKFFFASSCEIFQTNRQQMVAEDAPKSANNPYGISKLSAHSLVQYYRDVKGIFACNGILFNHESELRDDNFVSKKICSQVANIVKNAAQPLYLGNIHAQKDWGYAKDFVKSFHAMLQQKKADDYVIATGQLHSVKDMVDCAFNALNYAITWHGSGLQIHAKNQQGEVVVGIEEKYFRPLDTRYLIGDTTKAERVLNFKNTNPFATWVATMTLAEYHKLS